VSRLGVAVVGLGVGEAHARAYLETGRCDIVQLYDVDAARAERLAAELGVGAVARRYDDVLTDPSVQVISIASPDDAHFAQALAAIEAGKHVFVEKPLCRSLDELRALRAALETNPDLHLASNLVLRGAPLWEWVRSRLEECAFGDIYAFDGDYLYGRLHKITDGWRKDVDDYSVMLGGGIHLVDLMLWLTRERPTAVTAVGNRISTEGTAFRYDDFVAATFEFPSGLVGRISANFGSVQSHQHVVRLFGTAATFIYDDRGARLHESRDPSAVAAAVEQAALPEGKGVLVAPFVDAVLGKPAAEPEHEFALIAACVAADTALARGERVDISYG
jgi:predicted dehydrogenase